MKAISIIIVATQIFSTIVAVAQVPAAGQLSSVSVSLLKYSNSALTNSVLCKASDPLDNSLALLARGRQTFAGVSFDVQGVIQLAGRQLESDGKTFPRKVEGIEIGQSCDRIQLLHAVGYADVPHATVAWLVLHYADGNTEKIAIKYEDHVLDWWDVKKDKVSEKSAEVAWTGSTPMAEAAGSKVRLFKTAFENPRPENKVTTIDYQSANRFCAPFMVAMTLEKGQKPAAPAP